MNKNCTIFLTMQKEKKKPVMAKNIGILLSARHMDILQRRAKANLRSKQAELTSLVVMELERESK